MDNGRVPCVRPTSAPTARRRRAPPAPTWRQWTAPFNWPIVAVHLQPPAERAGAVLWGRLRAMPHGLEPGERRASPSVPSADTAVLRRPQRSWRTAGCWSRAGTSATTVGLPDINLFSAPARLGRARRRWIAAAGIPPTTTMANGQVVILAGTRRGRRRTCRCRRSGPRRRSPAADRRQRAPSRLPAGVPGAERAAVLRRRAADQPLSQHHRRGQLDHRRQPPDRRPRVRLRGDVRARARSSTPAARRTTNTAEIIDLNVSRPRRGGCTAPMAFARRHHNLTVLPNGEVLATGGRRRAPSSTTSPSRCARRRFWEPARPEPGGRWRATR